MLTVSELLVFVNNVWYRITKNNACIISYVAFNILSTLYIYSTVKNICRFHSILLLLLILYLEY